MPWSNIPRVGLNKCSRLIIFLTVYTHSALTMLIPLCRHLRSLCIVLLCLPGLIGVLSAQNLVPNYSFETISSCPTSFGGAGATLAPPWVAPTLGTPDIFNACSPGGITDVPINFFGNQPANTGDGYAGFYCKLNSFEYREYIQAQLTEPLEAGVWYYVSFLVSVAEYGCPVQQIGAHFSVGPVTSNSNTHLQVIPQIESNGAYLNDYDNWMLISGCFEAQGGENYITLGNFHGDGDTPLDPDCQSLAVAYYYIEDVLVIAGEDPNANGDLPVELGDPVVACNSYEIEPQTGDYYFIWSDGSHNPTLTVNESGTYYLTVTNGCNYGIDSIDVLILGNSEAPDLGPNQLTICAGDTYTISLDADLSEYTWQDGSHDPEYSITTPGIYSVTLDDGCEVFTDQIDIDVLDPPAPFNLGDDGVICDGEEIEITLDPGLGDYLWMDGWMGTYHLVTEGGTYAVTISNMCGEASDEIVYTDLGVPEVEIGPDEITLCDGQIFDVEIDPDLGEILWQDGSDLPNYEIYLPGYYSVFVTNVCGTGSDQVEVTVLDQPEASLGPDTILCPGEILLLSVPQVDATYVWQDMSGSNTFLVNSPGTYSILVSNACDTAADTVVVTYAANVIAPDFGPDIALCPGEQIVLHATSPGAAYTWQDGSTLDSFLVTAAGTYSVVVTSYCNQATDTIQVSFNSNPPQVDLPSTLTLCQGQSVTLDAVVTGVNYLWNDASQNQQLTVNSPGTYSVTVSNTCGADMDTVIINDGGPAPLVDLGPDTSLCPGETLLIAPAFSDVTSWSWQDGSSASNYTAISAGLVSVMVSNACGSSTDSLTISPLPATPPLNLGPDTSLCSGESVLLSIATPNVNILWHDGSSSPDFLVSGPGEYIAAISNACGSVSDTLEVLALPDIPALDLGADQSLCPGETITIAPGINNVDYQWQDGSTANTFVSTQQETVILTISNACGSATDTLQIFESNLGPQLDLGQDIQVCAGQSVTIPSGISGVDYLWQDGSDLPSYTTTQSGTFILRVSNLCGSDSDTIVVDISGVPPVAVLGPDTTLCENLTLLLTALADSETSIAWQDGSSASSFLVSSAGTYFLSLSNRCGDSSDTVSVEYLEAPDAFSLGPDTTLCPGETLELVSPATTFNPLWQDGTNQSSYTVTQPGTYSLQLSNDCGAVDDNILISYDTRVPNLNLDPVVEWCMGDIITLDASQSFSAVYLWSTGDTSPSIDIFTPGSYSVEVSTPCSVASQLVDIIEGSDCATPDVHNEVFIPNVFSPNGDNINDVFSPSFGSDLVVTGSVGTIYDRWGNLVYRSNAIPFTWDGLYAGEVLMPGVYVYTIVMMVDNGQRQIEKRFSGDVTLVR